MRTRRLLGVVASVAILTGVGTGVAVAVTGSNEAIPGAPREPVATVEGLATSLEIFHRERTGADTVPARLADMLRRARPDGVNVDLARRSFVRGETSGYLIPSQTGVCLWLVRPINDAGGCDAESLKGPGTTFLNDRPVIYAIVPDGVDHVTFIFADGGESKVLTEANTYYLEAPEGSTPVSVSYTTAEGKTVVHDVYVPDISAIERRTRELTEASSSPEGP